MPLTSRAFGQSILGKVAVENTFLTANAGAAYLGVAPCDGEVVDVVVGQNEPGTVGTDVAIAVKKSPQGGAVVDVLDTQGKVTRAGGAGTSVDARAQIAAVAGCVRPVITATVANRRVKKGDALHAVATETGGYTVHPTVNVQVIIRPDGAQ